MKIWDWVFAVLCAVWALAMLLSTAPAAITAVLSAPDASVSAAWAQAILSAAAILASGLVAVGVTGWQLKHQQELHRRQFVENQLQKIAGLAPIFANANQLFQEADVFGGDGFWLYLTKNFNKGHFDDVAELLEVIPLHDLGSPNVSMAVINLRRAVSSAGVGLANAKVRVVNNMETIKLDPIAGPRKAAAEAVAILDRAYNDILASL